MPSGRARSWRPSSTRPTWGSHRLWLLLLKRIPVRCVRWREEENEEEDASSLSVLLVLELETHLPLSSGCHRRILTVAQSTAALPFDRAHSMRDEGRERHRNWEQTERWNLMEEQISTFARDRNWGLERQQIWAVPSLLPVFSDSGQPPLVQPDLHENGFGFFRF